MKVHIYKDIKDETIDRFGRKKLGYSTVPLGPKKVRIYDHSETKEVDAELIKENSKTVLVKLPSGKIIKRHKKKHLVENSDG